MRRPRRRRRAVGLGLMALAAVGCGQQQAPELTAAHVVPDSALDGLLLDANEIRAVMHGMPLIAQPVDMAMDDNRNLLPNLNCLGVWHAGETAIYGAPDADGGWTSVRRQLLRAPGGEQWRSSVVQSVTSYPTVDNARAFFTQSTERWSKCTNHTVNITLNDQRLPRWLSGELETGPESLVMPISRTDGTSNSSCQHVVSHRANLIIDVQACVPDSTEVTQASEIANRIASHVPTAG